MLENMDLQDFKEYFEHKVNIINSKINIIYNRDIHWWDITESLMDEIRFTLDKPEYQREVYNILRKYTRHDTMYYLQMDNGVEYFISYKSCINKISEGIKFNREWAVVGAPELDEDTQYTIEKIIYFEGVKAVGQVRLPFKLGYENPIINEAILPSTCKILSDHAFYDNSLSKINLENIEVIESSALSENNLKEIRLGNKIHTINSYAFFGSNKIEKLDLSNTTISEILDRAFENCPNLTEVKLPETLETLEYFSFRHTSIEKITLPRNLKAVSLDTFSNTPLREIVLDSARDINYSLNVPSLKTLYVPYKDIPKNKQDSFELNLRYRFGNHVYNKLNIKYY